MGGSLKQGSSKKGHTLFIKKKRNNREAITEEKGIDRKDNCNKV